MAQIVDEIVNSISGLYADYPGWLVTVCLVIVGLGVGFALWKLIRFGFVVFVTLLLLAIVGFAGWVILGT